MSDEQINEYYDAIKSGAQFHDYVDDFRKVLKKHGEAGYSWVHGKYALIAVDQGNGRLAKQAAQRVLAEYDRKIMKTDQRAANRRANWSLVIAVVAAIFSAVDYF